MFPSDVQMINDKPKMYLLFFANMTCVIPQLSQKHHHVVNIIIQIIPHKFYIIILKPSRNRLSENTPFPEKIGRCMRPPCRALHGNEFLTEGADKGAHLPAGVLWGAELS